MAKQNKARRKGRSEHRRSARVWALSMIYATEFSDDLEYQIDGFAELVPRSVEIPDTFAFASRLARGAKDSIESMDEHIQKSSPRWKVRRMDLIDRNILRLAAFELFETPDVPPRVVINEAVELAKRYGTSTTKNFVNGILQQICIDNGISLADETPPTPESP